MATRRKTLTDTMIAKLKPSSTRQTIPDPDLRGHYVRVTPSGAKSFVAVARAPDGKQVWATIGACDHLKIVDARDKARDAVKRIKAGLDPFERPPTKPDSFGAVADNYIKRRAKNFRTKDEFQRVLNRYVLPRWRDRDFLAIQRTDVTALLDDVEDASGARQADVALMVVRAIMNWQAARIDDYVPPIVRGMRRDKATPRDRVLSDDEIRLIWPLAVAGGSFGALVRLGLLTAQRREVLASMRWQDVDNDGVWHIPTTDDRAKGDGGNLKLPKAALDIVRAQKRIEGNPFVFPGRGEGHFNGWSPCKRRFDGKVMEAMREAAVERGEDPDEVAPLPRWTIHDLRRTARSIMAKAGVREFVAERVLGHAVPGVQGIYDRHDYVDEKGDALAKLAARIDLILKPPAGNVVTIERSVGGEA